MSVQLVSDLAPDTMELLDLREGSLAMIRYWPERADRTGWIVQREGASLVRIGGISPGDWRTLFTTYALGDREGVRLRLLLSGEQIEVL